jgi:lactate dehydrogenase-like 2-hydroxyacid dehydrogenase
LRTIHYCPVGEEDLPPTVIVAVAATPAVKARAAAAFNAIQAGETSMDTDTMLALAAERQAQALMFSSGQPLNAAAIAKIPASVRIAATMSVGYDHVDVAAARRHGLIVTNTPDVLTDCTADMAMLLILAACRRAREYQHIMEAGWRHAFAPAEMLGVRVTGRTLGIVGLGRIGRAVAARARAFGMAILYTGRHRLPPELEQGARYFASLEEMLPHCQILSLHAPGGADTQSLMNEKTFAALPRGAVFINTARGSLVDEDALIAALASGHLQAAGLDVFRNEPAYDLRLRDRPNLFLTPHMGSATVETRDAMGFRALDNIAAVLEGRPPIDPLSL